MKHHTVTLCILSVILCIPSGLAAESTSSTITITALQDYDFGQSREALASIEATVRTCPVSDYPTIEAQLLAALASPKTTLAGKQFICRMLRRVGSASSVPALAKLLPNKDLSHMARFALQHMNTPQAGSALRQSLATLTGDLRIGVIGSIGLKRDDTSVAALIPLLANSDEATTHAVIKALGHIASPNALRALSKAKVNTPLQAELNDAILKCADKQLAQGNSRQAAAIYRKMTASSYTTWIRIAAYRGLVQAEQEKSVPLILTLLKDSNLDLQRAAAKFIASLSGTAITQALGKQLNTLPANAQILLLSSLEARGDKAATPYVAQTLSHPDTGVRIAAIGALSALGDASVVQALAQASSDSALKKAAMTSLSRISGPGTTKALVDMVTGNAKSPVRVNVIETLISRNETEATSALLTVTKDPDTKIRQTAYKALGELATATEIPALVALLLKAPNSGERNTLEQATVTIIRRTDSSDPTALIRGLTQANENTKPNFLRALATIGDTASLKAVRTQLTSPDENAQKAAIRALATWPNAAPLEDLMTIARTGATSTHKILAIRGAIMLITLPANRRSVQTVDRLKQANALAQRPEEQKVILAAMAKYPCQEALDFANQAKDNTALRREADIAAKKIQSTLFAKTLKVKASRNNNAAKNAIDGNIGSRWDTGGAMRPGDWFELDLGVERTITGLILDTRNSGNDFPRGYDVYASFAGGDWGSPILSADKAESLHKISFKKPVTTRFIKIVQKGKTEVWHWSIHELIVEY